MALHVSDFGTLFRATVTKQDGSAYDITGQTVTFRFAKPDGTTTDKTATVTDGPNGVASWTSTSGFLDQAGRWRWQAVMVNGSSSTFRTDAAGFDVYSNL